MASSQSAVAARSSKAASIFAALGDERRLELLGRLGTRGPQSIARLTEGTRVSRQAVTKHLNALARAGLVHGSREGRERIWEIRAGRLAEVRSYLDQISAQWDGAIERLRAAVETDEP